MKKQPFLKQLLNKKEKLCNYPYDASNLILIVDYRSICKAIGVYCRATKQVQAFFMRQSSYFSLG